jgi:DHA1 family tetracycline resistance protein-like MFS transporter
MKNKQLLSVILVVFIDLLGFSLILPLLPYFAATFGASAFVTGLLVASYAAAQLIGAPVLGRLSDRYGRRPILLASVLGTALGFLLLGFAAALWVLFVSRVIDGLTGGNLSVAQAYISDVTDAKDRARGLGMIGAAFGLGFIIGPAVGGVLSQWGYHVPALVAAGLAIANLGLIYLWLPESLPAERRGEAVANRVPVSLAALLAALKRPFSGPLLISRFVFGVAFAILQLIFSLYALEKFGLTATQTGYILAYVGVVAVITQGFLVGKLVHALREDVLILACAGLLAVGLAAWAWAPTVPIMLVAVAPVAFAGGMLNTLLSSTLTKAVDHSETGGILGFSAAIESSTRIIAPVLGGALLQELGAWAPGALGAVLMTGLAIYIGRTIFDHEVAHSIRSQEAGAS